MLPVAALLYSEIVLNTFDMFYFEVLLLLVLLRLLSDSEEDDEDYFLFTNFASIDILSLLTND